MLTAGFARFRTRVNSNVGPHRTAIEDLAQPRVGVLSDSGHPAIEHIRLNAMNHAQTLEGSGLHDATLESVTMSWENAEVSVVVGLLGGGDATLTFHEVTSAVLPRELPWGPSVSVNEARTTPDGGYEIEMQSGDTLRFSARSWSMRLNEASSAA